MRWDLKNKTASEITPIAKRWRRVLVLMVAFGLLSLFLTLLSIHIQPIGNFALNYFARASAFVPLMDAYVSNGIQAEMMKMSALAITIAVLGLDFSLIIFGPNPSLVPRMTAKNRIFSLCIGLPILLLLLLPLFSGAVVPGAGPHYTKGDRLFLNLSSSDIGVSVLSSMTSIFIGFLVFMVYLVPSTIILQLIKDMGKK